MMKKERFEAFTDAVIAIILTILVLEIHLPDDNHSWQALTAMAPQFFAYLLTFIFIATMWVNHHFLFSRVTVINNQIIWINIGQLSSMLYVVNVICFNLVTAILRRQVIKVNHITNMANLVTTEYVSFAVNLATLLITYFYPPFPFFGLAVNIIVWFLPHTKAHVQ
ncbi:TMEM175 family protein [Levilactobacillus cerevisiae]|uniref:TMEM175 family protein n=1 Tax=Levilactobacillus cerevisiae TaxID=1704076 RepID=UPI001CDB5EF1|nr:TMEM175 family protein [Levilactobacillus cerevisiae]